MKIESADDLLWGAAAIGREISRTPRQTFHLLERRLIPATKVGKAWVASRAKLRAHFGGAMPHHADARREDVASNAA